MMLYWGQGETCRVVNMCVLFIVVVAHGKLDSGEGKSFDGIAGQWYFLVHLLLILWTEVSQHEVNLHTTWEIASYPELQPAVLLCAQHLCYVLQSVVSSGTS